MLSEVWPEGDVFGSAEVEPEEELDLLKQILFAELPSKINPEYFYELIMFYLRHKQ